MSAWTPEEIEVALRREWWINHGHDALALYGDDGEMQCSRCPADFKRQTLEDLAHLVVAQRAERWLAEREVEPTEDRSQ